MIKVYFETGSHAEHVATLDSEPTTETFWDAMFLVAQAKGFDKVTESIEHQCHECGREIPELQERCHDCEVDPDHYVPDYDDAEWLGYIDSNAQR